MTRMSTAVLNNNDAYEDNELHENGCVWAEKQRINYIHVVPTNRKAVLQRRKKVHESNV